MYLHEKIMLRALDLMEEYNLEKIDIVGELCQAGFVLSVFSAEGLRNFHDDLQAMQADEISKACAASSIAADAVIARNEETIKRIRAMQPLMKQMGDALERHADPIEDACVLAKSLAAMLLEIKRANPDSANIEEAEDMACSIVIDLAGEIRNHDRDPIEPDLPTSPFDGMSHLRATGRGV